MILCVSSIPSAIGHGVGGETLPPVTIDNRNTTIFIQIEPSLIDPNENVHRILVNFFDADTTQIIEHVTYQIEMKKSGKQIFKEMFHDEIGNLIIKIKSVDSEKNEISGQKSPVLDSWIKDWINAVTLEGPIFTSGGLYEFDIEILTMNSDENFLVEPLVFNAAISIADKTRYDVKGKDGNNYQFGITSWYDKISNFSYDTESRTVNFKMPFDWSLKTLEQITILHEELHISKNFGDMLVTKYDVTVNGIPLPENSIVADDYSEEDRIVHVIIPQKQLLEIQESASKISSSEIEFNIVPSKEIVMPLTSRTTNIQYEVDLWWEPPEIKSGQNTKFFVDVTELFFIPKEQKPIFYDFVLEHNDEEIYRKTINAISNSPPKSFFKEYEFSNEQVGPIKVIIEGINDQFLTEAEFMVVVEPQDFSLPQFPIRVPSVMLDDTGSVREGNFLVDITWFSNPLLIDEESEFIITIYDKIDQSPIPESEYDFVLIKDGLEIFRKSGFAIAGGSYENFAFTEKDLGDIVLRIENIDGTSQFVEIPISITPEFPLGSLMVLSLGLFGFILMPLVIRKKSVNQFFDIRFNHFRLEGF